MTNRANKLTNFEPKVKTTNYKVEDSKYKPPSYKGGAEWLRGLA